MAYANWEEVALRIHQVLKTFKKTTKLYDDRGSKTLDPKNARKFFIDDDKSIVSLDDEDGDQIVRYNMSGAQTFKEVSKLIDTLRNSVKNIHPNIEFDATSNDVITSKINIDDETESEIKIESNIRTYRDIVNEMFKNH